MRLFQLHSHLRPVSVPEGPDSDAGILPRSLAVIFSSIGERLFSGASIKPHRCRDFSRLGPEQQTEEVLFKRNLLRQLKEVRCSVSGSSGQF